MTSPFISITDLGSYMGQDLTGNQAATMAIDAACEAVRTFTRREFTYIEDDEITLNGSFTPTVMLPEWPVYGDPTVEVDGTETTDWVLQESRLVRTDGGVWPGGVSNIAVTYTHGYADEEADVNGVQRMPSDIRMVAVEIAAGLMSVAETRFHVQSPRDSVGGSAPVEGPAPATLTEAQASILKRHQDFRVA